MKNSLIMMMAITAAVAVGCQKEKDEPLPPATPSAQKTNLLAEVYINDVLKTRYYYGSNKRLSKAEWLNNDGSVAEFSQYEYVSDSILSKIKNGGSGGLTGGYEEYTADATGNIVSCKYVASTGEILTTVTYEYSPLKKNQLASKTMRDAGSATKEITEYSYKYDVLYKASIFTQPVLGGAKKLVEEKTYNQVLEPEKQAIYKAHYRAFGRPDPDVLLNELVSSGYVRKSFDAAGTMTLHKNYSWFGKLNSNLGHILSQELKIQNIVPANADVVFKTKYTYTEH